MPTLARLLLVFATLFLGPLVAMADKLPKDTNKIESLTVEEARKLAETFPGAHWQIETSYMSMSADPCLPLNGLDHVDGGVARALAGYQGMVLSLNGLTTLDTDAAKALAGYKNSLQLLGLTRLDAGAARALAGSREWTAQLPNLRTLEADAAKILAALERWDGQLAGLTAFESPDSIAVAQALATRKGPLSLPNLEKISPKTLSALIEKRDVDIPLIETLEFIQEPDGSPTDDFLIPEWLDERQKQPRPAGVGKDPP
jgi:hypothetical protein